MSHRSILQLCLHSNVQSATIPLFGQSNDWFWAGSSVLIWIKRTPAGRVSPCVSSSTGCQHCVVQAISLLLGPGVCARRLSLHQDWSGGYVREWFHYREIAFRDASAHATSRKRDKKGRAQLWLSRRADMLFHLYFYCEIGVGENRLHAWEMNQ